MLTQEEKNDLRVYTAFRTFTKTHDSEVLVALDFDELLVEGHLSRAVINALQGKKVREEILVEYPDYSFEAIAQLSTRAVQGYSEIEVITLKQDIVRKMPWREGAIDVLNFLHEDPKYTPLVLSCGRYRSIRIKLDQEGLEHIPAIGTEIMYEDGVAVNRYIMTDELKGGAMNIFNEHFKKTYAIGHSSGDIPMLQTANVGIALRENPRNEEVEKIADHTVDNLAEAYLVLKL